MTSLLPFRSPCGNFRGMAKQPSANVSITVDVAKRIKEDYDMRVASLSKRHQENLKRQERLANGRASQEDLKTLYALTGVKLHALAEENARNRQFRQNAPPGTED